MAVDVIGTREAGLNQVLTYARLAISCGSSAPEKPMLEIDGYQHGSTAPTIVSERVRKATIRGLHGP